MKNNSTIKKIAVIGSGAAGYSVIKTILEKNPDHQIFLFDYSLKNSTLQENLKSYSFNRFVNTSYVSIKKDSPFSFFKGKYFFGMIPEKYIVHYKSRFWKSNRIGGLTNYWGACMRPFPPYEFKNWPFTYEELLPYYQKIMTWVGISGQLDGLDNYFKNSFFNRPAIKIPTGLEKLISLFNSFAIKDQSHFFAGINRIAIETREGINEKCQYCGECFLGCFYQSIFSTTNTILNLIEQKKITWIKGKVTKLSESSVFYKPTPFTEEIFENFDRIYVCAGCIGSTEIIMRSKKINSALTLKDNPIFQFPIFSLKKINISNNYLALSNILVACRNKNNETAEFQIHPHPDFLIRSFMPEILWRIFRPFNHFLKNHILWARMYLHSDFGPEYEMTLDNDIIKFSEITSANKQKALEFLSIFRNRLSNNSFFLIPNFFFTAPTSSHLAGPLSPYSEIFPNVHICDSSIFPSSPATSLTFTIMANACRIVDQTL